MGLKKAAPDAAKGDAAADAPAAAGGEGSITLTTAEFEEKVMQSETIWMVEFFAPWYNHELFLYSCFNTFFLASTLALVLVFRQFYYSRFSSSLTCSLMFTYPAPSNIVSRCSIVRCGHCKRLEPEWTKAGKKLGSAGPVRLATVDGTVESDLSKKYDVKGYPTIKVFGKDKSKAPTSYEGQREAKAIVDYALDLAKPKEEEPDDSDSKVVILTKDNFEETVLQSSDLFIVEFFAPWCGHCKKLAPIYKEAAEKLSAKEGVKLASVDCTQHADLCTKYDAKSYPTLKVFPLGKNKEVPELYEGGRTVEDFVAYVEPRIKPVPEVSELTDMDSFEMNCMSQSLCVIAFLPHILDDKAAGRNQRIELLSELALDFRSETFSYLWAEAFTQPHLEKLFDVGGGGYPSLVVYNPRKGRIINMVQSWSKDNIAAFFQRLLKGKERSRTVGDVEEVRCSLFSSDSFCFFS